MMVPMTAPTKPAGESSTSLPVSTGGQPENLQHRCDDRHHGQRQRQKHLPAQPHELIVAVARHECLHHCEQEEDEQIFRTNQTMPGTQVNGGSATGGSQPPRNMIVIMAHMVAMAMYSPRKNSRNGVAEYSTA